MVFCQECNKTRARLIEVERSYLDLRSKVKKIFPELLKENENIKNRLEQSEKKLNFILEEKEFEENLELDEIITILKNNNISKRYINETIKITKSDGAVHFDYADILTIIKNRKIIKSLMVKVNDKNKFIELKNKIDLIKDEKYDGLLINIISNEKITLGNIRELVKEASKVLYQNSPVIWSSTHNKKLGDKLKIFMLYAK